MNRILIVPIDTDWAEEAYFGLTNYAKTHFRGERSVDVSDAEQLAKDLEQVCRHAEQMAVIMTSVERLSLPEAVARLRAAAGLKEH